MPAQAVPSDRAAGGGGSPSVQRMEGGARAGEGRRGTATDSDPGRAGPRRSAAATRPPGARECARDPAPSPARPPARLLARAGPRKEGRRPPCPVRAACPRRHRAGATPSAWGGGGDWAAQAADRAAEAEPPSRPRRPRGVRLNPESRPGPGRRAGREGVPGGGGLGCRAYLCAEGQPLRPGQGNGDQGRSRPGRRGGGGCPAARRAGGAGAVAWAARRPELDPRCRRSRWRAQPARPPGLDSFTDTTLSRPAPRRDTPAPRRLPPPVGRPASPPLGVTHPGAHTPSRRPSLPLAHTALLTPLSGFVSAHTHVLTQIPSLHTPSLAPFPPHFLEGSPCSFRTLLACPTPTSSAFPKPPPHLYCPCYSKILPQPARVAGEAASHTQESELCSPQQSTNARCFPF